MFSALEQTGTKNMAATFLQYKSIFQTWFACFNVSLFLFRHTRQQENSEYCSIYSGLQLTISLSTDLLAAFFDELIIWKMK